MPFVRTYHIYFIIFTCVFFISCDKENIGCGGKDNFCLLVESRGMEATIDLINDFLEELENDNEEESLQELITWLACKSCIKKAELKCLSCIYTLPAQSEITIDFLVAGKEFTRILDISMSDPLSARGYHE